MTTDKVPVTLLPCPWCNETDALTVSETKASGLSWWGVECHGCNVHLAGQDTREKSIEDWNTRLSTPQSTPVDSQSGGALREAAQFLSDRLDSLEWLDGDLESTCRDYMGHVDPAHARLKAALTQPSAIPADRFDGFAAKAADIGSTEGVEDHLRHVIDRDRYAAAIVLNNIKKVLAGRQWLKGPGRGSYEYDDTTYQTEFGGALDDIEAALSPLAKLAFDKTDCTTDSAKVQTAREAGRYHAAVLTPAQPATAADIGEGGKLGRADVERCPVATAHCVMNECVERCAALASAPSSPDQSAQERIGVLEAALNLSALAIEMALETSDDVIEWAEPIRKSKRGHEDDDDHRQERKSALYTSLDDARRRARTALGKEAS